MREPAPWSLPGSSPGADAPGLDSPLGACAFHGATASEAAAFAREHLFIALRSQLRLARPQSTRLT